MQDSRSDRADTATRATSSPDAPLPVIFEETYLRYAPRLRKVAIGKFQIAPDDADALVQDVFTTFFVHAQQVEQVERYLIGAICNASRKHIKRSKPNELFCDDYPCAATSGDMVLRRLERQQILSRVFARIGGRCRDLLYRFYMNGESTAALAASLDSTPNSVAVTLHKCRRRAVDAYRAITEKP